MNTIAEYIKQPQYGQMAILFNRFSHWERADIESFKEWYFVRYNKNRL